MGEQGQGGQPTTARNARWRPVRRAAIGLILVGSAVVLFVVRPSICKDTVAGTKVVHVCEPVGVTSAPALLVLIAIVLLLLPEVSEISITGLFTLKERVDQAEQQVTRTQQQLMATRDEFTQLRDTVHQTRAQLDLVSDGTSSLGPPSGDGDQGRTPARPGSGG